jgi:hypothetical protein
MRHVSAYVACHCVRLCAQSLSSVVQLHRLLLQPPFLPLWLWAHAWDGGAESNGGGSGSGSGHCGAVAVLLPRLLLGGITGTTVNSTVTGVTLEGIVVDDSYACRQLEVRVGMSVVTRCGFGTPSRGVVELVGTGCACSRGHRDGAQACALALQSMQGEGCTHVWVMASE